jgi:UPF0042 nucleotide-binding protein
MPIWCSMCVACRTRTSSIGYGLLKVVRFMRRHEATREYLDRLTTFLNFALPQYVQEGKSYLTVAIGCTGGQHRSVMVAEALKKSLSGAKNVRLRVKHRDS